MKLKISILEDRPAETQHLKSRLDKWSLQTNCELEISEYCSGEAFFRENNETTYSSFSVLFLDIQ